MQTESFLLSGVLFFLLGALVTLIPDKKIKPYSYLFSVFGAISFLAPAFYLALAGPMQYAPLTASSVFEFSFRGDALSGFFMITLIAVLVMLSLGVIGCQKSEAPKPLEQSFVTSTNALAPFSKIVVFCLVS